MGSRPGSPAASSKDIDYLLEQANAALQTPLTRTDVVGVYAGLRPLIAGEGDDTTQFSREHAVAQPTDGLISIAGGKYTTYRVMAADAVDAAVADLDRPVAGSNTDEVPLIGANAWSGTWSTLRLDSLVNTIFPSTWSNACSGVTGHGFARARHRR